MFSCSNWDLWCSCWVDFFFFFNNDGHFPLPYFKFSNPSTNSGIKFLIIVSFVMGDQFYIIKSFIWALSHVVYRVIFKLFLPSSKSNKIIHLFWQLTVIKKKIPASLHLALAKWISNNQISDRQHLQSSCGPRSKLWDTANDTLEYICVCRGQEMGIWASQVQLENVSQFYVLFLWLSFHCGLALRGEKTVLN